MMKKLSIIIPVYNELNCISKILNKINKVKLVKNIKKEIIIIDDNSDDGTKDILLKLTDLYKIIFKDKNEGKGSAIIDGLNYVTGDYIIIQDGDLEYEPNDYNKLINELSEKKQVIYGSRRLKNNSYSHISYLLGGIILSKITNIIYNQKITDEATCYKLISTKLIKSLNLECKGFEFCPEVTAKISRLGYKIYEVPVNYYPRKIKEGKKIKYIDGIKAIKTLIKFRKWKI